MMVSVYISLTIHAKPLPFARMGDPSHFGGVPFHFHTQSTCHQR